MSCNESFIIFYINKSKKKIVVQIEDISKNPVQDIIKNIFLCAAHYKQNLPCQENAKSILSPL